MLSLPSIFVRVGYIDPVFVIQVPLNPWPKNRRLKEIGRYQQANMLEGMEAYTLALFSRVLGWSRQEILGFLVGVREEIMDRSIHIYSKCFVVYAQNDE